MEVDLDSEHVQEIIRIAKRHWIFNRKERAIAHIVIMLDLTWPKAESFVNEHCKPTEAEITGHRLGDL